MKDKELEELKQSIASIQTEYKQLQGNISQMPMEDKMRKHMDEMYSMLYRMNEAMYGYVDRVANRLYEHTNNGTHIPPILGPGKMKKVLKALSMGDDYECMPKTIYASKDSYIIEAEYKKPKD